MTFDPKALRGAFSSYMTGVTVVTACAEDGSLVGFTANSFTSVSLDPPLLLVCPGNHLNSYAVFEQCEHFAVNILADDQEAVSNEFARSKDDRFSAVDWTADTNGCPIIAGTSASFSCRVHSRQTMGDHLLLIGEVVGFEHSGAPGLGYCSNGYFTLGREREANAAAASGKTGFAGVIVEHDGQVLLMDSEGVKSVPHIAVAEGDGARSTLKSHIQSQGLDISLGPVYSIYDDKKNGHRYTFFTAKAASNTTANMGSFYPIETLPDTNFVDTAQAEMVKRYCAEYQTQVFGLYVGDAIQGEVHHGEKQ